MKAFDVQVNGERACTAALRQQGLVEVRVRWVDGVSDCPPGGLLKLDVLGITAGEILRWSVPEFGIGDCVDVSVVEASETDEPATARKMRGDASPEELAEAGRTCEFKAMTFYTRLVKEFPEHPAARFATQRIEVLKLQG